MSERRPTAREIAEAVARGRRLWTRRLARDYDPVARRLLEAYRGILPRLDAILEELGDPLAPVYTGDDVEFAVWVDEFRDRLAREIDVLDAAVVDAGASMQASGARIGARFGVDMVNAGGIGIGFNQPLVETIEAAIDYVDSPAWRDAIGRLGSYHADRVADLVATGVAQGKNPREIARLAQQYFNVRQSPLNDAYNLVQTTHMYSARRGAQAVYQDVGVERWRWSAAMDARTCRACVSLHGTVHPVEQVLNDHHRGRCAMIPITPAWRELGFSDGREPAFETGVDYFNRQDAATQRAIIGNDVLYEAIRRGEVRFSPEVIAGTYENEVFGEMRRMKSYREIVNLTP